MFWQRQQTLEIQQLFNQMSDKQVLKKRNIKNEKVNITEQNEQKMTKNIGHNYEHKRSFF